MACSKTIESVTVDLGPLTSQIIDGIIQHHQVGGLYITQHEFDRLRAIWEGHLTWMQLPCRLAEIAGRFTRMGASHCRHETTFNLCRLSMGLRSDQMDLLYVCFQEEKRQEEKDEIDLFVRWLLQKCTIKEEHYILEHSFIVPYCNDHDMCKLFHGMNRLLERKSIRFCCCAKENCDEFCNFHECKKLLSPLSKVVKSTAFLKHSCTFCQSQSKKCKFS